MTLQELVEETLTQKHRRLMREKCKHREIYSSTVSGPHGTFAQSVCLDCGQAIRAYGSSSLSSRDLPNLK